MSIEKKVWRFMPHKQNSIDRRNTTRARMDAGIGMSPMEYCYKVEEEERFKDKEDKSYSE